MGRLAAKKTTQLTFDVPLEPAAKQATAAKPVKEKKAAAPQRKVRKVRKPVHRNMLATVPGAGAVPAPVEVTNDQSMFSVIARAAADPKCDPDKMRALFEIQKDLAAQMAKVAFIEAFQKLQRELPEIRQDGKIVILDKADKSRVVQSTPFATFQNIMRAVRGPLSDNGFTLSFSTEPSADASRLIVRGFLSHEKGHFNETAFPVPIDTSGSKNNIQGWGSSMSYGKRYAAIALLNIISYAPEDRDLDGATPKPELPKGAQSDFPGDRPMDGEVLGPETPPTITEAEAITLIDAIEAKGLTRERFCRGFKIAKVHDLPKAQLAEATQRVKDYQGAA